MIHLAERMNDVHSDIRGPLYREALRMQQQGLDVLKLNTGNPAAFGFPLPESIRRALEGRAASGKSTLGALLERVYGANLFHMDDYFLPFERKTPERLAEPGGNVDYERAYEEIISRPKDAEILWRPFDCSEQGLGEWVRTAPKRLTVVEGCYSMHPTLRDGFDLKVFLDIDPERQSERILERNGPEMHARFVNEWIPLENRFFDGLEIRKIADLAFDC
jgi:dephospho-CoA kinase